MTRGRPGSGGQSRSSQGRGGQNKGGRGPGGRGGDNRPGRGRGGARRPGATPTPRPQQVPSGKRGQVRRSGPDAGGGDKRRATKRQVGGDQVEGRHAVYELLTAGARAVREVWVSSEVGDAPIVDDIRELADDRRVPVRDVAKAKFYAQARCEAPQGVLALAAPLPEFDLDDLLEVRRLPGHSKGGGRARPAPFMIALDGVTDPGNLGAVLRSAECAGVTGAILPRHRAVNVTPAATKAAAGAVEHLPIALVGGLPNALAKLKESGVWVIGLAGEAEDSIYSMPPAGESGTCIVLGAEGRGLSRLVSQRCDALVRIPMHGELPSLNVAAAAALACFEVSRSR